MHISSNSTQFKNVLKENMHITLVPNKSHNVHPKIQVNKWPIIQLQHNEALMHSEYSIMHFGILH